MKLNKQLIKKINSPKSFFIFVLLIIFVILFLQLLFHLIRKIFNMDKKYDEKLNNAKQKASATPTKPN
jgi:uncharacterized membrane protein